MTSSSVCHMHTTFVLRVQVPGIRTSTEYDSTTVIEIRVIPIVVLVLYSTTVVSTVVRAQLQVPVLPVPGSSTVLLQH